MADPDQPRPTSVAASQASRRNGVRSRGPRTAAGKKKSARNAFKHGLRASQPVMLADLPSWMRGLLPQLEEALGLIGQRRRELLDRFMIDLVLLERTDRLIAAEFARLFRLGDGGPRLEVALDELDFKRLRTLIAYRKRFRASRHRSIPRMAAWGRNQGKRGPV